MIQINAPVDTMEVTITVHSLGEDLAVAASAAEALAEDSEVAQLWVVEPVENGKI